MNGINETEARDLRRICAKSVRDHHRQFILQALFAISSYVILLAGLIWMANFRSPTLFQSFVFIGVMGFCCCLAYITTSLLGLKYARIILHLERELRRCRVKS